MSLLARLIEAGTPPELIEEVALLIAEKKLAAEAIDKRRAADRDRQARRRADTDNVTSRDITGQGVTDEDTPPLSAPPNDIYSNPPHHTPPKTTKRARGGSRLPDDWEPKPLTGDTAAAVATWPAGAIERELARFRDWAASATGPNSVKSNWDAAWRNWLRRIEDEGKYGRKNNHSGGRDNRDGVAKALDRRLGLDPFAEPSGRPAVGRGSGDSGGPVAYLADLR